MAEEIILPPSGERVVNSDGSDVTEKVYGRIKKAWGGLSDISQLNDPAELKKANETVTTATGLVAINLEAPSKGLYPVLTPIRNAMPRVTPGVPYGTQAQWREVTAISGPSTLPFYPFIREGQRGSRLALTESDRSAPYVTIGMDADVTFEAQAAAAGFEDEYSMTALRLLQQVMIMEEDALLGANRSKALGVTASPTLSASGTGTLPNATYSVRVFALTHMGYRAVSSLVTGIYRQVTLTDANGDTYVANGGSSGAGAAATQATTGVQNLNCSVTAVDGAVAYAWFVGTAGAERLEAITTINSVVFSAPLAGTGQTLASVASAGTDYSYNDGTGGVNAPSFNGLMYAAWASSVAIKTTLATGTAGTGTVLSASGSGGVTQLDTMLKSMWDSFRLSPEVIWVNSQQINDIRNKIFGGTSNGTLRHTIQLNGNSPELVAGVGSILYPNIFHAGDRPVIPIKVHPTIPPGTIMFWAQNLPAQYQSANVPMVARVNCRRDYYQIPWPQRTRRQETGVYAEQVLQVYAPFAIGILNNVAAG